MNHQCHDISATAMPCYAEPNCCAPFSVQRKGSVSSLLHYGSLPSNCRFEDSARIHWILAQWAGQTSSIRMDITTNEDKSVQSGRTSRRSVEHAHRSFHFEPL